MDIGIRPLLTQDIEQVRAIEKEAFSTDVPWYLLRRDIGNAHVGYLVAWESMQNQESESVVETTPLYGKTSIFARLFTMFGHVLGYSKYSETESNRILGYVSLWFLNPEAHITAIAVSQECRGHGVGELLLIGSIETAMRRGSDVVTLEVRISNYVAQSLYEKYGFAHVGIRKAYYADNREDASIMTTQSINSSEYREQFSQLQDKFKQRRGEISMCLV